MEDFTYSVFIGKVQAKDENYREKTNRASGIVWSTSI